MEIVRGLSKFLLEGGLVRQNALDRILALMVLRTAKALCPPGSQYHRPGYTASLHGH